MRWLLPSFVRIGGRAALGRTVLRLIGDNRGVTAIEYALITALIVMGLVALITRIGDFVSAPFVTVANSL